MFREEMGDKPYLQIEVDEQYSAVGIITRIEAFLNSISHRPPDT
jgi:predicted nucleotide-binding protein (sugar kinase/HSP70/actin superfamily)